MLMPLLLSSLTTKSEVKGYKKTTLHHVHAIRPPASTQTSPTSRGSFSPTIQVQVALWHESRRLFSLRLSACLLRQFISIPACRKPTPGTFICEGYRTRERREAFSSESWFVSRSRGDYTLLRPHESHPTRSRRSPAFNQFWEVVTSPHSEHDLFFWPK